MGYVEAYRFHFFPAAELYTDEISLGIHASHWLSHFAIAVEGHYTFPFTFTYRRRRLRQIGYDDSEALSSLENCQECSLNRASVSKHLPCSSSDVVEQQ